MTVTSVCHAICCSRTDCHHVLIRILLNGQLHVNLYESQMLRVEKWKVFNVLTFCVSERWLKVTEPKQCSYCLTAADVLLAGQRIAIVSKCCWSLFIFWLAVKCFCPLLCTATGGGNCVWCQSSKSGQWERLLLLCGLDCDRMDWHNIFHGSQIMYPNDFGDPLTFPYCATMKLFFVVLSEISQ